jgi:hypothetical protein
MRDHTVLRLASEKGREPKRRAPKTRHAGKTVVRQNSPATRLLSDNGLRSARQRNPHPAGTKPLDVVVYWHGFRYPLC